MGYENKEEFANWMEHVACDAEEGYKAMAAVSSSHPLPVWLQGVEWGLIYAAHQARTIDDD